MSIDRVVAKVKAGCACGLQKGLVLPVSEWFVRVHYGNSVDFHVVNEMALRGRGDAFKQCRGAPGILIWSGDQPVVDGVVMDVFESGIIGFLEREAGLPEVVPYFAFGFGFQTVDPCGGFLRATRREVSRDFQRRSLANEPQNDNGWKTQPMLQGSNLRPPGVLTVLSAERHNVRGRGSDDF